jgi:cytoskeletal protein RodZ
MSEESDETRRVPPADDATLPAKRLDDTVAEPASSSADDRSIWSGRAEVRSPRPAQSIYDTDWSDTGPLPTVSGRRDRWWMPIVVGIVVLLLLGVLAWAIYMIVQNSGEQPGPATTTPPTAVVTTNAPSIAPSTAPSSPPSTEPSTIPTTTATTQEPTAAVTVPALRGLPLAEARAALNRTRLPYRLLYRNSTAAPGTVIDSDPPEGQEVPPDTRVTIVVAQGDATTTPTGTATATG